MCKTQKIWIRGNLHDMVRVVKITLSWLCLLSLQLSEGCDGQDLLILKVLLNRISYEKKLHLRYNPVQCHWSVSVQNHKTDFVGLDAEFPDSIQLFFISSHSLASLSSPSWLHVCKKKKRTWIKNRSLHINKSMSKETHYTTDRQQVEKVLIY